MGATSLTELPNDVFLDIIEHLDTGRDVSHLGQAARRTHQLVEQHGWRAFVRRRFPSFGDTDMSAEGLSWADLAERYTYLDRCWDMRAVRFDLFSMQGRQRPVGTRGRGGGGGPPRQAVGFQGVVDARNVAGEDREVVAWGAGEDLHVRWAARTKRTRRRRSSSSSSSSQDGGAAAARGERWASILGVDGNYSAGTGDVTALKLVDGGGHGPRVVVGRANGDVQVLSATDDAATFGRCTRRVVTLDERRVGANADAGAGSGPGPGPTPPSISPGRLAVSCTEWQPASDVLAASRSSLLHLFRMPRDQDDADLERLCCHDLSHDLSGSDPRSGSGFGKHGSLVRDIKFLDSDRMAVALGGSSQPIQYGTIQPSGIVFESAVHSLLHGAATSVWALQPVGHRNSRHLVLSSWQDGTFRLLDARTPSAHDAIYRDNLQPYDAGPLLVYGTERFVAGKNNEPTLCFFDFRFPKPYFHSTAAPCSPLPPEPRVAASAPGPSDPNTDLDLNLATLQPVTSSSCHPGHRSRCPWHALSRTDPYRQDATVWLPDRRNPPNRVFSLAKASNASDTFYLGLRDAIAEAHLILAADLPPVPPHQPRQPRGSSAPQGWHVRPISVIKLAETGIGLRPRHSTHHPDAHARLPELFYRDENPSNESLFEEAPPRSRLDSSLRRRAGVRSWRENS
ncbi:hypothetical protein E4U54_007131 [Claviceps lovelessii]|nr:hypothetical protein E4U54_007131 [Claviceps lovelessii]